MQILLCYSLIFTPTFQSKRFTKANAAFDQLQNVYAFQSFAVTRIFYLGEPSSLISLILHHCFIAQQTLTDFTTVTFVVKQS